MTHYPQTEALILKAIEEGKYRLELEANDAFPTIAQATFFLPGGGKVPSLVIQDSFLSSFFTVYELRRWFVFKYRKELFTIYPDDVSYRTLRDAAFDFEYKIQTNRASAEDSRIAKLMEGRL